MYVCMHVCMYVCRHYKLHLALISNTLRLRKRIIMVNEKIARRTELITS